MQIALITGEASGDRVGGQLASEIKRLRPDATIWGTGGKYLRETGVEVLVDTAGFGTIGVVAAVRLLPQLFALQGRLRRELLRRRPDVLVTVDAGAFNVPLCAWTKRHLPGSSTRVLYYFPPASWRRQLRGTNLAGVTDRVATPFPWSETELRRFGVNATFVGHPLLDLVHPREPTSAFAERVGLDLNRPVVGLLPGSRPQEIEEILPAQLLAAAQISARVPGVQFLLALAPTVSRDEVMRHVERVHQFGGRSRGRKRNSVDEADAAGLPPAVTSQGAVLTGDAVVRVRNDWQRRLAQGGQVPGRPHAPAGPLPLAIVDDATYDVMAASDVLLTTSGTATLEAAILNKPMVIVYRMSRANVFEYAFVKSRLPPHFGLPNLLLDKRACPELIQDDATPGNMAQEVIALLLEPERLLRMKNDLQAAVRLLGEPGGARRTAEMVVALAEERHRSGSGGSARHDTKP